MITNALEVKRWVSVLRNGFNVSAVDENTTNKILELFAILDEVKAVGDDNRKELWLSIRRPTVEEYISWNTDDWDEVERVPEDTLREWYADEYREEMVWFPLTTVDHHIGNDFYGVFLDHDYVLAVGDDNAKGWPIDATEFVDWIIDAVKTSIGKIENGTYQSEIDNGLPYKYRTGKILRKDYWDIYPDLRAVFRADLSDDEISEFISFCKDQDEGAIIHDGIDKMTARDFYEACALCYDAVGYKNERYLFFNETAEEKDRYGGLSAREKYFLHADGRDDGLSSVPLDDPDAFEAWANKDEKYYKFNGSHPFEIRTSASVSLSIHLLPRKDRETGKWYYELTGSAQTASYEIVRYYNAMKKAGLPVYLYDAERIVRRYTEDDMIGILPRNLFSFGQDAAWYFDDKTMIDCDRLEGDDKDDQVISLTKWLPEKTIELN